VIQPNTPPVIQPNTPPVIQPNQKVTIEEKTIEIHKEIIK